MKKQGYHKTLKLFYDVKENGLLFQDGVFYKNSEIKLLKKNPGFDYVIIHAAKKLFNAEVINYEN